jgi:pimeloyl-ACP methyl ester carboxylesterase
MEGSMRLFLALIFALSATAAWAQPAPAPAPTTHTGSLPDGTAYRFDVPATWNGTLLIGLDYAAGRTINPTSAALLARGYAMAGTTRLVTGWDVTASIANQLATIDLFTREHRAPARVFVLGSSLGAHTGAATIQARPERFQGAVLACGGLAGSLALWDSKLDALFVAKTLLAAADPALPIIGIPDDFATTVRPAWLKMLAAAQQTPAGRARIALAAVIAQLPTWSDPRKPQPAASNLAAIQEGLYDSLAGGPLPVVGQAMSSRNEIERRSGGNISSNMGVDYAELLRRSGQSDLVAALYREAGIPLQGDLDQLARAPRVTADPKAQAWAMPGVWDGNLRVPVITLNGIGDNISPVSGQERFARAAINAGKADLLRQTYTNTAGHCGFSPGETVAAVEALTARVASGRWGDTSPASMHAAAATVAGEPGRFVPFQPTPFMR